MAIKISKSNIEGLNEGEKKLCEIEIDAMKEFWNSPFTVRYIEGFICKGKICIVMEYASGGSLEKIIDAKKNGVGLGQEKALKYFAMICLGILTIH